MPTPGDSHVQGYYGTVSHNVRSVYNRYLGWYDGNPANLHPHPPVEAGRRYVAAMGGPEAAMVVARDAFDEGDLRWVVEVLKHLIFADPGHQEARRLSADAMEQLGYQSESGTWRNAYLTGAQELRHGSLQMGPWRPQAIDRSMAGEQLVDMIGTRFDPSRFRPEARLVLQLTDVDEAHLVGVGNHTIHHQVLDRWQDAEAVDVVVALDRATLVGLMADPHELAALVADGRVVAAAGDLAVLGELLGALDVFHTAALVEP